MAPNPRSGLAGGPAGPLTQSAQAGVRLKFLGQPISCRPVPRLVGGKLPPGEHPVSWQHLVAAFGRGSRKRELATDGLHRFALMLHAAGGKWLFVDGSFTSCRERPSDWDGCFLGCEIDWQIVDPRLKDVNANRQSLKADFKCDVFDAETINGETGKPFREFFQQDRNGKPKGILVLDLGTVK